MKILFRVDASTEIGSGHVMRCLTLADALSPIADILFICRSLLPKLETLLLNRGYGVQLLPSRSDDSIKDDLAHSHWLGTSQAQDVHDTKRVILKLGHCDWLVVDHYSLDYRFEMPLRGYVDNILVIDDLADRRHDCDLLIDQNHYDNVDARYKGKVPDHCRCLLGTQYCFLRQEFLQIKNRAPRSGPVRSILIYFGGVDSNNYTQEAVEVVLYLARSEIAIGKLDVNVVVGSTHPALEVLRKICLRYCMGFHVQTNEIAKMMVEADLAIGAGGISTYERLYLRLPALLTPISANQREPLRFMAKHGYFKVYENRKELEYLLRVILNEDIVSPPDCVENGIPVLVQAIQQEAIRLKRPTALNIRKTFYWLLDKDLRRDILSWLNHQLERSIFNTGEKLWQITAN